MFIVIPSYKRENILAAKSYNLLQRLNVPSGSVYIFVVKDEKCSYKMKFPGANIIEGPVGLDNMRNFITQYFPEGEELLCMDDDIDDILIECNQKLRSMTSEEFADWTKTAFSELHTRGASLFGVYPVKNAFFMKDLPLVTYDLRFCVGALYGVLNRQNIFIETEEKEDFDRTLQHYTKDQCVVRYNSITVKTNYYKTKGGMQARNVDRIESSKRACEYLLRKYPEYTRLYTGKKTGIWEVRLLNVKLR